LKDEIDKQAILRQFITEIKIDYMDDLDEHVIEIQYKIPIYADGTSTAIYTSDGMDLKDGSNVIKDYDFRTVPELQKKRTA